MADTVTIVMKIPDVTGKVSLRGYTGWINCSTFALSGAWTKLGRTGTNAKRASGMCELGFPAITRPYDRSVSHQILQSFMQKRTQTEPVEFKLLSGDGGGDPLIEMTLTDAAIYGFGRSGGVENMSFSGKQLTLNGPGYDIMGMVVENVPIVYDYTLLRTL